MKGKHFPRRHVYILVFWMASSLAMRNAVLKEERCTKRRRWWDQWEENENARWYIENTTSSCSLWYTCSPNLFPIALASSWAKLKFHGPELKSLERSLTKTWFVCDFLHLLFYLRIEAWQHHLWIMHVEALGLERRIWLYLFLTNIYQKRLLKAIGNFNEVSGTLSICWAMQASGMVVHTCTIISTLRQLGVTSTDIERLSNYCDVFTNECKHAANSYQVLTYPLWRTAYLCSCTVQDILTWEHRQ